MKDLAQKFLTKEERARIEACVRQAETETSGEIVTMVVSSSYHYPLANLVGAAIFALPLSLLLTPLIGGRLWLGTQNLWIFLGSFTVLFVLFHELVKRTCRLKRIFTSDKEMDAEVQEAAVTSFFREGLYKTRDEVGVLIFISVFEHKVWVLADRGINAKLSDTVWQEVVDLIIAGIKKKIQADAICQAIEKVGALLKTHFPIQPDDTDELKGLIIGD
jgi:putative membrane protein